jgi:TRAP-type C4-dicarboxylate transport system permease small subunit
VSVQAVPAAVLVSADDPHVDIEDADEFSPQEDISARAGRWVSQLIVIGLVVMMGVEMIVRTAFGWSLQFSTELGGYALVAIAFLSLPSGQLLHAYHRVHFLDHRLGALARASLRLVFNALALAVVLVLTVELARFEWITFNSGDVAATGLMTPLWIPRLLMPVGGCLLALALVRTLRGDWHRVRAAKGVRRG